MLLVVQLFVLAHVAIPWPPIAMASKRSFIKFHPIKKNVLYRLWNPVSNGLIKKDPEDLTTVYCSGAFDTADANNSKPKLSILFCFFRFHSVLSPQESELAIRSVGVRTPV